MNTTVKIWLSPEASQGEFPISALLHIFPELEAVTERDEAELIVVGTLSEIDGALIQDPGKFVILYRAGASVLAHYFGSWRGWKRVAFCDGKMQLLTAAIAGFIRAKILATVMESCGGSDEAYRWTIERRAVSCIS